jgi:hypothetical protein
VETGERRLASVLLVLAWAQAVKPSKVSGGGEGGRQCGAEWRGSEIEGGGSGNLLTQLGLEIVNLRLQLGRTPARRLRPRLRRRTRHHRRPRALGASDSGRGSGGGGQALHLAVSTAIVSAGVVRSDPPMSVNRVY